VCNYSIHLSGANRTIVEGDLQPVRVGDMFRKPYPRPYWADSRKQCAGMNAQVSARVKAMQALSQPEPQDVAASAFGPSGTEENSCRLPGPAFTGSTPPTSTQTSQMKAEISENQRVFRVPFGSPPPTLTLTDQSGPVSQAPVAPEVYLSPHAASSQGSSYVKQELLGNLVHSSINVHRSSKPVLTLLNSLTY
jgi:hypothetical protein